MTPSAQDRREFLAFCHGASDRQLAEIARREAGAGRKVYAQIARSELSSRRVASQGVARRRAGAGQGSARRNPVVVTRIRLNRGGYDSAGRYFGAGAPLYQVDDTTAQCFIYLRASTARDARAKAVTTMSGWKHYGRSRAGQEADSHFGGAKRRGAGRRRYTRKG